RRCVHLRKISKMFEIGYITALFYGLGIGVLGFVLGALAMSVRWMKSEDSDVKRGYIEISGSCYQLQPMDDPLLSHVVACQPHQASALVPRVAESIEQISFATSKPLILLGW